jgi:hypothetical protein
MRFLARLGQVGTLACVLGCCNGFSAIAQKPMDVAKGITGDADTLNGTWNNVDPQARGLVQIIVDGKKVRPYGACHPVACSWGDLKAQVFSSGVRNKDAFSILASQDSTFKHVVLTISLEPDGRLRVQTFTHFTDTTDRRDYSEVDYFSR